LNVVLLFKFFCLQMESRIMLTCQKSNQKVSFKVGTFYNSKTRLVLCL
jgi:hypothetical protein